MEVDCHRHTPAVSGQKTSSTLQWSWNVMPVTSVTMAKKKKSSHRNFLVENYELLLR